MEESITVLPPSNPSLKEQKELFVTGHDGTTPWEILMVCAAAPIGIWLFQSLRTLERFLGEGRTKKQNDKRASDEQTDTPAKTQFLTIILLEGVILWLPVLICQTNLLYPWGVILLWMESQTAVFIHLYFWTTRRWMRIRKMQPSPQTLDTVREDLDPDAMQQLALQEEREIMKDSMTVYRSSLQYLTFVAILAVDFHVFPRRFAKTEEAGYGLMDLGAGSFVVAAGLVSSRARQLHPSQQSKRVSFGMRDIQRITPLLVIGCIRLATNKGLEYQEHVSEYGVHWNFFFTLAFISPLGSMLPGTPNWIVPTSLLAAYQVTLSLYGGQSFILEAPRTHCSINLLANVAGGNPVLQTFCTLFVANREGVLGCIGYLFLYLASEYIAHVVVWHTSSKTENWNHQGLLWTIAISLWALLYVLVEVLGIEVSRRSTNASFCVWTLAHNMVLLAAIHASMRLNENPMAATQSTGSNDASSVSGLMPRVPIVFQAVNRHGFISFLVANLLTGLTNLTINTMAVSDAVALFILFVYLCAVGCFALALHYVTSWNAKGPGQRKQKTE